HPFESAVEYDAFIEANPLYSANVPEGKKFTKSSQIREDKAALYVFELSTLPIKPQMSKAYAERYISYLESSQAEALDWIRSQGIDPEKVSIVWRPNPKEMRGKMLGETTKPTIDKTIPSTTPTPSPTPTPTPTGQSAPTPEGRFPL